jgi:hypothetical protein
LTPDLGEEPALPADDEQAMGPAGHRAGASFELPGTKIVLGQSMSVPG